ncbi:MAG: ATP-dependent Clp protease ATP-binding subunit, partial [bacterium]|nr:ATP-dependent Clp protease ATP-binding subunit [bacterium]
MMFPLTPAAQQLLKFAEDEARKLNHPIIGTEHLLLGAMNKSLRHRFDVFLSPNVNYDVVLQAVEEIVGRGKKAGPVEGFSPRVKKVLEIAYAASREHGLGVIDADYIFIGLLDEGEGVAALILKNLQGDDSDSPMEIIGLDKHTLISRQESGESPSAKKQKNKSKTPTLDSVGRDLTKLAQEGLLDPVIGREKETERVIQILSRRNKNNPVLIGEPGVGKTAIVEGLANRIVKREVPETLAKCRVVTLDVGSLVAGTKYRGEFEERLKKVIDEIGAARDVIVFIDEMHTLVGAGGAEGAIDASNILKPALARGELQCIGATTLDEYRKYVERDAALERRFQPVMVEAPTPAQTIEILKGLRDRYEAYHRVEIPDETLEAAVTLSDRYIADR